MAITDILLSLNPFGNHEISRNFRYVKMYDISKAWEGYSITFDGKEKLWATPPTGKPTEPATMCLSVHNQPQSLYDVRLSPLIYAKSSQPILNKHLKKADLIKSHHGNPPEKCYYADKKREKALLSAFDKLVEFVGLEVLDDYRRK